MSNSKVALTTQDEPMPETLSPTYISGPMLIPVVLAILLSMFLVALDMSIIATAIPQITVDFHSLRDIGWYGSAFFMCLASFVSFWGKLYKYLPLKPAFVVSILVFEIGSLICAIAKTSMTLIVGRAIQGAGGAGVTGGCYIIIAIIVAPPKVPAFMGMVGAVFSIASVAGPIIGGVFTQQISWRWCFYINLPVGGLTILTIVIFYHTPAHAKPVSATWKEIILSLDIPGTVIILSSLISLSLAMTWGGVTSSWASGDVVGTLIAWAALTIVFAVIEWRQQERAIIIPRIMKQKTNIVLCAFIFCFARNYNMPIYFQAIDGVSPTESGIRVLPTILSISLFTWLSGVLITRIGYFQPFLIVGSLLATVGSGLIYTLDIGSCSAKFISYQIVAGIGIGTAIQIPVITAQALSERQDISVTTTSVLFFQFTSSGIGVSVAQNILSNRLIAALSDYAPGVDVSTVLNAGTTSLRDIFAPSEILGILQSYMVGLRAAWILSIALAGMTLGLSLLVGWKSIKLTNVDSTSVEAETVV